MARVNGLEHVRAAVELLTQLSPDFVIPLGQLPLMTATQADDEVDAAGEVVPSGQDVQEETEVPFLLDLYVPSGQAVHVVFPVPEAYDPAGHSQQEAM